MHEMKCLQSSCPLPDKTILIPHPTLVDRHRRRPSTLVPLGGHDLVVVATQILREREKDQLASLIIRASYY